MAYVYSVPLWHHIVLHLIREVSMVTIAVLSEVMVRLSVQGGLSYITGYQGLLGCLHASCKYGSMEVLKGMILI